MSDKQIAELEVEVRRLKDELHDLMRLRTKVRDLEEDLHNRARAAEKRIGTIEQAGDDLIDRVEIMEQELALLKERKR